MAAFRHQIALVLVALCAIVVPISSSSVFMGRPECPCLAESSPNWVAIKNELRASSYPEGYGQGCKQHDKDLALRGCSGVGGTKYMCSASWCYVNPDLCPENKAQCEAAGGKLGSDISPFCRTVDHRRSDVVINGTFTYYSYSTCGFLNDYSDQFLSSDIAGRHLKVKALSVSGNGLQDIWLYSKNRAGQVQTNAVRDQTWAGADGVLRDIVEHFALTNPPLNLSVDSSWASAEAKKMFPLSSYTACCLDVMVGRTDLCVGDFWLNAARLKMGVTFLPPYDSDNIVLISPSTEEPTNLATILSKPWRPFTGDLWAAIWCYVLFVVTTVTLVTDYNNHNDFSSPRILERWMKAAWLSAMAFVTRAPKNAPASTPARIATFGFAFFLLVTLQSYTAALASILVARDSNYRFNNMNEAVNKNARICVMDALRLQATAIFPKGQYVSSTDEANIFQNLNTGKCDVALLAESKFPIASHGEYNKVSCFNEDNGIKGWEKGSSGCERDSKGKPTSTRDCAKFRNTGDLVMQVPLSMPVSSIYLKAFSKDMQVQIDEGKYVKSKKDHQDKFSFPSACGIPEAFNNQLGLEGLAGTIITAIFIQVIALIVYFIEVVSGKPISNFVGLASDDRSQEKKTADVNIDHDKIMLKFLEEVRATREHYLHLQKLQTPKEALAQSTSSTQDCIVDADDREEIVHGEILFENEGVSARTLSIEPDGRRV
jgi:hypothetical protein